MSLGFILDEILYFEKLTTVLLVPFTSDLVKLKTSSLPFGYSYITFIMFSFFFFLGFNLCKDQGS